MFLYSVCDIFSTADVFQRHDLHDGSMVWKMKAVN